MACIGCSGEEEGNLSHAIDVPNEGLEFAQALNEQDASKVANWLWFPGPEYPEVAPVEAGKVPAVCVEGELALFAGREIDLGKIHAEHRVLGGEPKDLPGINIAGEWDLIWLTTTDGTEDGRQFETLNGRVVFNPQQNQACDDAAREQFGEIP